MLRKKNQTTSNYLQGMRKELCTVRSCQTRRVIEKKNYINFAVDRMKIELTYIIIFQINYWFTSILNVNIRMVFDVTSDVRFFVNNQNLTKNSYANLTSKIVRPSFCKAVQANEYRETRVI